MIFIAKPFATGVVLRVNNILPRLSRGGETDGVSLGTVINHVISHEVRIEGTALELTQ